MRKTTVAIAVLGITAATALSACSSSGKKSGSSSPASGSSPVSSAAGSSGTGGALDGKGAKVGIILPETGTSQRWITADPVALKADCDKANLKCDIANAQGNAATMKSIAEKMESNNVKVLMLVAIDPSSAAAIEQGAKAKGILTVDYDRFVDGGTASLYVSFDNTKVGELQGQALTKCSQVQGQSAVKYVQIDGAPTDNNAALFKKGYESVLPKTPGWKLIDDQTGNWDVPTAKTVFTKMLQATPSLKAVMVANDDMAGGVVSVLQNQNLNGKVAVGGQDATAAGLQRILSGDQCYTIYKPSKDEAGAAVDAVVQLVNGKPVTTKDTITSKNGSKTPAILATTAQIITKANVKTVIADGYASKAAVCTGKYAALCAQAGI
ncbi:MAG: sugar ABC transporter substrate-binding protein [Jatrophihabitans sp.]